MYLSWHQYLVPWIVAVSLEGLFIQSLVWHIPNPSFSYEIYHTYEYGNMYTRVHSVLYSYKNNDKIKPMDLPPKLWNCTLPLSLALSDFITFPLPLVDLTTILNFFVLIILLLFFLVLCVTHKHIYVLFVFLDFELLHLLYEYVICALSPLNIIFEIHTW